MPDTGSDLALRAKRLPAEERERLIDELLVSIDEPDVSALDEAWSAEVEDRLAAFERGEVWAVPAEVVFAKARALAK